MEIQTSVGESRYKKKEKLEIESRSAVRGTLNQTMDEKTQTYEETGFARVI